MNSVGIPASGPGLWVVCNIMLPLLAILALILMIVALMKLRGRNVHDVAKVMWAFLILVAPIVGSIAFFLVRPGTDQNA